MPAFHFPAFHGTVQEAEPAGQQQTSLKETQRTQIIFKNGKRISV